MDNPLLDFSGLPRFDAIRPDHIAPAIESLLAEAEAAVAHAETVAPVTWAGFVTPLEDATVGALADVLRQSTVWYFWWD